MLHTQEDAQEASGGSQLEALMGPPDASCTEAAVQGGTAPAQDSTSAAEHAATGNEEKSIVPVSFSQPTPFPADTSAFQSLQWCGVCQGVQSMYAWTASERAAPWPEALPGGAASPLHAHLQLHSQF